MDRVIVKQFDALYDINVKLMKLYDEELEKHQQINIEFEKEYEQLRKQDEEFDKKYDPNDVDLLLKDYKEYLKKLKKYRQKHTELNDEHLIKLKRCLQIREEIIELLDKNS